MATVLNSDDEPRVLQLAKHNVPFDDLDDNFLYLRALCRLSTFLQQDTSDVNDDIEPLEENMVPDESQQLSHGYVQLSHAELPSSPCFLQPERDVLWFSHETEEEDVNEMKPYYGPQLKAIQNVMFQETEWSYIDECLELMKPFAGIKTIYVWLDSYRFLDEASKSSKQDYLERTQIFQARDAALFKGRNLMVQYIDDQKNIYGGFRVPAEE